MTAKIEVTLEKLKLPIIGMGKIDIMVDGAKVLSMSLGETESAEVTTGKHVVEMLLHGIFERKSKAITISVAENSTAKIRGKYSRMWGNMKLQSN